MNRSGGYVEGGQRPCSADRRSCLHSFAIACAPFLAGPEHLWYNHQQNKNSDPCMSSSDVGNAAAAMHVNTYPDSQLHTTRLYMDLRLLSFIPSVPHQWKTQVDPRLLNTCEPVQVYHRLVKSQSLHPLGRGSSAMLQKSGEPEHAMLLL